jgi:hypothetical protein
MPCGGLGRAPGFLRGSAAGFRMSNPRSPNRLGRRWEVNSLAVLEDHRLQATSGDMTQKCFVGSSMLAQKHQMDWNGMKMYEGNVLQHASLERVLGRHCGAPSYFVHLQFASLVSDHGNGWRGRQMAKPCTHLACLDASQGLKEFRSCLDQFCQFEANHAHQ